MFVTPCDYLGTHGHSERCGGSDPRETGRNRHPETSEAVYYCQAWHLVWESERLFSERIEAWAGGPVVPDLFQQHHGRYRVGTWPTGNAANLTESEKETIDTVVDAYGRLTGHRLSHLTHSELPWRKARLGLAPGERGNKEISTDDMQDYYSDLEESEEAVDVSSFASEETY